MVLLKLKFVYTNRSKTVADLYGLSSPSRVPFALYGESKTLSLLSMVAEIMVLVPKLSFFQYMRSAQGRFLFKHSHNHFNHILIFIILVTPYIIC